MQNMLYGLAGDVWPEGKEKSEEQAKE